MVQYIVAAQPVSIEHPGLRLPEYEKLFQEPKVNEVRLAELRRFQQQFPDSAIRLYKEMLERSIRQGQALTAVRTFLQLGDFYTGLGQYQDALETLQHALSYCGKMSQNYFLPYIYNHFAHVYKIWGNYEMAVLYLYRALLANEQHQVLNKSYLYNNLAIVLMDIGADKSAWYYLDVGEECGRQHENYEFIGGILLQKGSIRYQLGDFEDAMHYYKRVLEITHQHDLLPLRFSVLNSMARVQLTQKRYDEAFESLRAAQAYEKHVSPVSYNSFIALMGAAYLITEQYPQAEYYLRMAHDNAVENRIASDLMATYDHLSEVYARTGKYKLAYDLQKRYTKLRDSLLAHKTTNNINKMEVRYRTAQKDKEIANKELLLARQQSNIRTIWAASIGILLVLVVFYVYKQRLQKTKIAALKQEEKLKSLHAFIKGEEAERRKIANDLHDGVGGLLSTSIMYLDELPSKYTVLKQAADYKEVVDTVTDALEVIRKTAHSLMPELVIRYGLPHSIRLFCNKIERGGKLQVDFQCYGFDERLFPEFELSIYRIVQELMQNVIRHAGATKVLVQISAHHDVLSITVEDNGVGIPDHFREGMGLATIRARMLEMNGQFSISRRQPNGTNAYLEFDLQMQKRTVT